MKPSPEKSSGNGRRLSIKVTRVTDGWLWMLIDSDDELHAGGAARDQQRAMEAAWKAAKLSANGHLCEFPDIVVEHSRDASLGSGREQPAGSSSERKTAGDCW